MEEKAKALGKRPDLFVNLSLHSSLQGGTTGPFSNMPSMRILLLDDDAESSSGVIEILEGNPVLSKFDSGASENLLDFLKQDLYDLLIFTQPENNDYLVELIRINQDAGNIPAVLVSNLPLDAVTKSVHASFIDVVTLEQPANLLLALQRAYREIVVKHQLKKTESELLLLKAEKSVAPENTAFKNAAENFSQIVLASITESIAVLDENGIIVHTNQSWKDFSVNNGGSLLGTSEGVNYLDVCKKAVTSGDDIAALALTGITDVIHEKSKHFELEYPCHSDLQRRWFLMRVSPFQLESRGILITHLDISDKKSKEQELELSYKELLNAEKINNALISGQSTESLAEFMLQSLYETAGVQRSRIYLYNKISDKLELYAQRISNELTHKIENRSGVKLSTLIPELFDGGLFNDVIKNKRIIFTNDLKEIRQLVSEHTSNRFLKKLAAWAQKLAGIKTFGLFPLIKGDEVIGLLSTTTPIILNERERKTVLRLAQHASLVISRKMEQDQLRQNEEKFRTISNYTANWETWVDNTGKLIWMNPAAYNHSGYTAEELLDMPDYYEKLIFPDDLAHVIKTFEDSFLNRTDGDNLEVRCIHKNHSLVWLSMSWKQVYNSAGEWMGIRSSATDITLRKKQEFELLHQQSELSEVQKIARLGSWEWNIASREILLSGQLCSALGIPETEDVLSQDRLLNLMDEESLSMLYNAIQRSQNGEKTVEVELKIMDARRIKKHFLVRTRSHASDSNPKTSVRGSALDITELRETSEHAEQNEERFRKIFESIQDVYYQTNQHGIVTLVSPSVYNLLGYTPEEVTGQPVSMLYVKPKLHELRMARRHLLGEKEQFEASLLSKSGEEIVVSINLSYLEGMENGNAVFQGLMRNITEKKRQEKSLENQRKRLLEIVKLNTQIIQTSDHFYYVIQITEPENGGYALKYVSTPVTTILGLTELDLLNREDRWMSLIHPGDVVGLHIAINRVLTHKKPQRVSYRINHSRSGETIWLDDYICPLLNGNDDVVEIYGSVKDVSERVNLILKIESEKRQSIAYQYQLLSSQLNPHFIYNTLNTFQYYILQGNIEGSLNHISDFSKLMRKVLENSMYNYITLDEEIEFLEHYMRISKQRMKEPLDFTIEVDEDVETDYVMIPPMLLQPYLENAMIHGFNECPRKPRLSLTIQKIDKVVQCIIEDNGIGREKSILTKGNRTEIRRSYAMGINKNRIDLLNQITVQNFEVVVEDLKDENDLPMGTRVFVRYHEIMTDLHV